MPINNHISECTRLKSSDLEYAMFETLEEFQFSLDSCMFSSDESGYWACEYDGKKYYGCNIQTIQPLWATHVYWYGK